MSAADEKWVTSIYSFIAISKGKTSAAGEKFCGYKCLFIVISKGEMSAAGENFGVWGAELRQFLKI